MHEKVALGQLAGIDSEVEVDLGAIVELADGLGVALMAVVLGVDLVVDGGGESGKAVGAIPAHDVGFHSTGSRIGDVDNGVRKRVVLRVENLAVEQAANGLLFLIGQCSGSGAESEHEETAERDGLDHRGVAIHPAAIVSRSLMQAALMG